MDRKTILICAIAALCLALTLAFVSCAGKGKDAYGSDAPQSTAPTAADETEAETETETGSDGLPILDSRDPLDYIEGVDPVTLDMTPAQTVEDAVADYYALLQGDFSKLGKYWYGKVSDNLSSEGYRLESEVFGNRLMNYAVPVVIPRGKWEDMWAEADEKFKDADGYLFAKTVSEGFFMLYDLSKVTTPQKASELKQQVWDNYSIDLTESGGFYVRDTSVSEKRLNELDFYFSEYLGYTVEDVRADAREVGMPDAELIGSVDRFFRRDVSAAETSYIQVEPSDEAATYLEWLCTKATDKWGNPVRYSYYDYEIVDTQYVSSGEAFEERKNEFKETTGEELLEVCRVTLKVKKNGERIASTDEYTEIEAGEQEWYENELYLYRTAAGWNCDGIEFPWGGWSGYSVFARLAFDFD